MLKVKKVDKGVIRPILDDVIKEPMHRLNIEIPKSVFSRYKAKIAMDKNLKSINEHLRKCINEYLRV